jgi:hypothetical protein
MGIREQEEAKDAVMEEAQPAADADGKAADSEAPKDEEMKDAEEAAEEEEEEKKTPTTRKSTRKRAAPAPRSGGRARGRGRGRGGRGKKVRGMLANVRDGPSCWPMFASFTCMVVALTLGFFMLKCESRTRPTGC